MTLNPQPPSPAGITDRSKVKSANAAPWIRRINEALRSCLEERPMPPNLRDAVGYALLAPGKRTRPLLALNSCAAVGGDPKAAMAPALGLEMIHAFSLVHDDLPAMDDDDLRRGRPTLHRHTNDAMAILAGDFLLGLAVEVVTLQVRPPALAARVCGELIKGCNNMIAGQVYDTLPDFEATMDPLERLKTIHEHKTGALIRAACRVGAMCGDGSPAQVESLTRFGEQIGLMFQVVDDLLDVTQTTQQLGKTAGKDVDQDKLTYPAVLGIEATAAEVRRLRETALSHLEGLGHQAQPLRDMCEYLAVRTH